MAKSYEELVGAIGRTMFFRPERRRVRDLLSRDGDPTLRVGEHQFALHDISMNGLSFFAPSSVTGAVAVGQELQVSLFLHAQQVYRGQARVARIESSGDSARVALALTTGFLDLPEVRRRDEEGRLARELVAGPEQALGLVPASFREALLEAVHFVQYYRQVLARHEARYRADGEGQAERLSSLCVRAADALRPRWWAIEERASRAAGECLERPEVLRAAKAVTETLLTPMLMECPMVRRSYGKPLGYPGDYQVMLHYYADAFEGDSVFARVFHKFFVEHPLSNGVRTRKQYVVGLMGAEHDRVLARGAGEQPFRVTSLGCGPAREVSDYAASRRSWGGEVVWTLIDQEEETLSVAYHACRRQLAQADGAGRIDCLNVSFGQILQEPALLGSMPPQDLIYSTGLFDYLRESRAQSLLLALYERLAPGGRLAIGNALAPNSWFFSPEFALDWTLLYRTREQMLRLAERLPAGAQVEVVVEPGKAYYFLLVRRPASHA